MKVASILHASYHNVLSSCITTLQVTEVKYRCELGRN